MKKTIIPTILSILFITLAWQFVAIQIGYPAIFPPIENLLKELWLLLVSENFLQHVLTTITRGLLGFCLAFIFAMFLSILSGFNSFTKAFMQPILVVLRSIPVISFVLLAILWFSPAQLPVFIALLTMFPILYQNILTSIEQTDKHLVEMATVFGKKPVKCFLNVYIPASKSGIYDGISTAMGFGWRAIIIGEVLAQPIHGIGTAMKNAQAFINVSELIAWTVIAILMSSIFELCIKLIRTIHIELKLPDSKEYNYNTTTQAIKIEDIELSNLEKRFNDRILFKGFNHTFKTGTVTCLKGISGKGKSTLLKLISGIEKPESGLIQWPENTKLAFAFQDFRLLPWLTVTENIAFVMDKNNTKQDISNLITYLLGKMELSEHAHKFPLQLSGGQQQRVCLARALAAKSNVLLLDEPLTGLDDALKQRIILFLGEWFRFYRPIVIWATHEEVKLNDIEMTELVL